MTILENEFDYIEEIKSKNKVEEEEEDDLTQELDLRNSTIKIKRKKTSLDISITKEDITSIKGVGARVAEKLKGANFTTIAGIASATVERLSQINGIGKATAEKIIEGAKTITDRKNLQDFTTSKRILSEQVRNEVDDKLNIKIGEELAKEEKIASVQEFKPWFHPKFKIKRSNSQISPERKKNVKVRSQKAVRVPNKTIPIHENSIEAEIINDYEMEDFEVEEVVEDEVDN
jgi:NAD-dependent DNA ligase